MTARVRPWLEREDWREGAVHSGEFTFTFDQIPFLLGGKLAGTLRARESALGEDSTIMLACFRGRRDSDEALHWRAMRPILAGQLRREGNSASIKVEFSLPADRPPTRLGFLMRFTWELSVLRGLPKALRLAAFQLPVFGRETESLVQDTGVARRNKRELRKTVSVFDE